LYSPECRLEKRLSGAENPFWPGFFIVQFHRAPAAQGGFPVAPGLPGFIV
jgi:hypothetical protein